MVHTVHCAFDAAAYGFYEQFRDEVAYVGISEYQQSMGPPGMNWAGLAYNAIAVEQWPYTPEKDDYLLAFGRVCEAKGFHLSIEAAKRTGRRLIMAGVLQEPYREYFEQKVAPHIDGDQIVYEGEVSDARKRELFAHAHAFVFPITWPEPFGLVMIEAMACGTPVVALRQGSVPEVVDDGVTGFVRDDFEEFVRGGGPGRRDRPGRLPPHRRGAVHRRAHGRRLRGDLPARPRRVKSPRRRRRRRRSPRTSQATAGGEAHPRPLFLRGDAAEILRLFPAASVDCVVTSPPYFGHRRYAGGGIGAEGDWQDYVAALGAVTAELLRVLKPTGSLWLNLGDTYRGKRQLGIPWRVAFHLTDDQGWTLRNSVVWHKVKGGPDTSRDRLRNVHELFFHFVRRPRDYYYDADAVRNAPRASRVENGAVVSATGVSGVRYRRQIELSTALSEPEKAAALAALDDDARRGRRPAASPTSAWSSAADSGRHTPTSAPSPAAPASSRSAASTSCATTPAAASPATCGTSCRRTRRAAACTSRRSRPTCAASRSLRPARGTASCWIPSADGTHRCARAALGGIDLAEEYLAVARERTAAL